MKRIAIPTRGTNVDDHFGHCEFYTIFDITDEKNVAKTEVLPSPQGCGCKSDIANDLAKIGVTILLAGNMGNGAKQKLEQAGLTVYTGFSGDITKAINKHLSEGFTGSFVMCSGHGNDHECENH